MTQGDLFYFRIPFSLLQAKLEFLLKFADSTKMLMMSTPLTLAWTRTINKSQGMTLDKIVVDLSDKESCAGLTYVALSRVKSLQNLLLLPVDDDRFHQLKTKRELHYRLKEELRLQQLAEGTLLRYSNVAAKSKIQPL